MIRYRELKRRYELDGAAKTVGHLAEALEKEQLRADDFSLRDLAEALIPSGSEWVRSIRGAPLACGCWRIRTASM